MNYLPAFTGRFFFWLSTLCLLALAPDLQAQQQPVTLTDTTANSRQLAWLAGGLGLGYTAGLLVLNKTWYSQSERTDFHFFNDNQEWKQMDKVGHFFGAFHEGRLGIAALRGARVPEKKAIWYGGMLGFVLQSPIEWLDGYAADYGASVGDLGANALGAMALILQELHWQETRIIPKFSFHQTRWAPIRPQVLGRNFPEALLKDYNGQTYWFSAALPSFLPKTSRYPKWLYLAFGYGAAEMVFGQPATNQAAGYQAYRQYYLSLDFNFRSIKTRHKLLKGAFWVLDMVHLPAPAVEYNRRQGIKLHPIYF